MRSFDEIYAMAVDHAGNAARVEARLPIALSNAEVAAIPDDRWLSAIAKAIFSAGFVWRVVNQKWPAFEAAFEGFDPSRVSFYADEEIDRLISDKSIIRNGQKIMAVIENAHFLCELAEEHRSVGAFFANWPSSDIFSLYTLLKKRGARLGGMSAQYMLRFSGKDTPVLSNDVVAALIREGVVDKTPGSKRALADVQAAFNKWVDESGRPYCQVSMTLALSIGPTH
ncbi:MAG: DNA-3-methyladenine glycosylase I [Pseudomonadota bacterium]